MVWRGFYGHGWVRAHFCIVANESKCCKMLCWGGEQLNRANYFPRKAPSHSVVTHKDKAHVCNWHCYFISTSILKQ